MTDSSAIFPTTRNNKNSVHFYIEFYFIPLQNAFDNELLFERAKQLFSNFHLLQGFLRIEKNRFNYK